MSVWMRWATALLDRTSRGATNMPTWEETDTVDKTPVHTYAYGVDWVLWSRGFERLGGRGGGGGGVILKVKVEGN